jgi:TM2 domain-containing membrane protein YozV
MLSQLDQVQNLTHYFLNIYCIILSHLLLGLTSFTNKSGVSFIVLVVLCAVFCLSVVCYLCVVLL